MNDLPEDYEQFKMDERSFIDLPAGGQEILMELQERNRLFKEKLNDKQKD
jgi:hypothetical protein